MKLLKGKIKDLISAGHCGYGGGYGTGTGYGDGYGYGNETNNGMEVIR